MPSRVCRKNQNPKNKQTTTKKHKTKLSEYLMCTNYVPFFCCRLNMGKDISADWL